MCVLPPGDFLGPAGVPPQGGYSFGTVAIMRPVLYLYSRLVMIFTLIHNNTLDSPLQKVQLPSAPGLFKEGEAQLPSAPGLFKEGHHSSQMRYSRQGGKFVS